MRVRICQQHANRLSWDGEGHIADGHCADLTDIKIQIGSNSRREWGEIEPDDERQKKGEPGEMKSSISPLE